MNIRDKVRYVPAGAESIFFPATLYVKYGANEKTRMMANPNASITDLRDRRVTYICGNSKQRPYLKNPGAYDEVIDVNSIFSHDNNTILLNAYSAIKSYPKVPFKQHKQVICDSGGFQLVRGVTEGVDIEALTQYYNDNCTIGMPLDIPTFLAVENAYFDRVTKIMKVNDEFMLSRLNSSVDLAMISHGSTLDLRLKRLRALERPSKTLALGGLKLRTDKVHNNTEIYLIAVSLLVGVLLAYPDKEYYHCLGETASFWFFIYAYLVGCGIVKSSIGGDSVTHIQRAVAGQYLSLHRGSQFIVDRKQKLSQSPTCPCPVCTAVGDVRLFHNHRLLTGHNLFVITAYKNDICDAMQEYFAGKVKLSSIVQTYLPPGVHEAALKCARYIDEVKQKGYYEWKIPKTGSLFAVKESLKPKHKERFDKIMNFYETYHGKKF